MTISRNVSLVLLLALGASCGGGDGGGSGYGGGNQTPPTSPPPVTNPPPSAPSGSGNTVSVEDNFFEPNSKSVAVGTTITWNWNGGYSPHSVTFDSGPSSQTQSTGQFQRTFSAAGTYKYHCDVHGTAMSGTVIVQ